MAKKKKDSELRDFSEVFDITVGRAADKAEQWSSDPSRRKERRRVEAIQGRVLAEDIFSDRDLPPYDRVAVDGYACRKRDLPGPLRLSGAVAAGATSGLEVTEGTCVRVMTGGVLPEGADTVVMIEQTEETTLQGESERLEPADRGRDEETYVRFTGTDPSTLPSNFSPRGEDVRRKKLLLSRATILSAKHTALIASVGYESVAVHTLPKVGLLSTGDEVVEPGSTPEPQQIRNANAPQTVAQLAELGIVPTYYGIIPDDAKSLEETIAEAKTENDLVLMSGGISMGDYDHGPEAMERNGFSILYDRVAVKPGRPTTFAVSEEADLFGLPGNPVSCYIMFEVLVKHYLYRLMYADYRPARCFASMAQDFERRKSTREEWILITVDEAGDIHPIEYHGSGHFLSLSRADGMIKIERGRSRIEKGASLAVRQI